MSRPKKVVWELHIYGTTSSVGEKGQSQHKGWGKKLIKEAEKIAKETLNNIQRFENYQQKIVKKGYIKVLIISGIGVRQYYEQQLGYKQQGTYMVKNL